MVHPSGSTTGRAPRPQREAALGGGNCSVGISPSSAGRMGSWSVSLNVNAPWFPGPPAMVAWAAVMLSERSGCRKGVPAAVKPGCKGPPELTQGASIDEGERCSGSPGSWRCSRDTMTAMSRTKITATAATRGIENQKRFSKVSRDRSSLLTRRSPSLNCGSVSLRRESRRRSTSLFRASTLVVVSLCWRSSWS